MWNLTKSCKEPSAARGRSQKRRHPLERARGKRFDALERLEPRLALTTFVTVNSPLDVVDLPTDATINDLPGPDGLTTLREAVLVSNNSAGAEVIGFDDLGAFATPQTIALVLGELRITDDVTLIGTGADRLVIDAQGASRGLLIDDGDPGRLLHVEIVGAALAGGHGVDDGGGVLSREDVVLTDCRVANNSTFQADGGGIYSAGGALTLLRTTVEANSTSGGDAEGGGVAVVGGSFTASDSRIAGNSTEGSHAEGGGVYVAGAQTLLQGTNVTNNFTLGVESDGGGAFVMDGSLTIVDAQWTGNEARGDHAAGGGIYTTAPTSVTASRIADNLTRGDDGPGGGVYAANASLSVVGSVVEGNSTLGNRASGGGVCVVHGGLEIRDSTVVANATQGTVASYGGGIAVDGSFETDKRAVISNSTLSGNASALQGGGLYNADGMTIFEYSTVTLNAAAAGQGGGVFTVGKATAITYAGSTIVAGNLGSDVDYVAQPGPSVNPFRTNGYNVVGFGNAVAAFTDNDQTLIADAGLATLGDNGGCTPTHALLPGSVAINRGPSYFVPPPAYDQRGMPFVRSYDGRIDVGAFEAQPGPTADFNQDFTVDGDDLAIWEAGFGRAEGALLSDGDADGDGAVGGLDFLLWQQQFQPVEDLGSVGQAIAATAQVEPLSAAEAPALAAFDESCLCPAGLPTSCPGASAPDAGGSACPQAAACEGPTRRRDQACDPAADCLGPQSGGRSGCGGAAGGGPAQGDSASSPTANRERSCRAARRCDDEAVAGIDAVDAVMTLVGEA